VWARTVRVAALLVGSAALVLCGCGSASHATAVGLRLQREDLIAGARALSQAQGQVDREAQASRAAWPIVANGLPGQLSDEQRAAIAAAVRASAAMQLPGIFQEARAQALTGPASSIVGDFREFAGLATRGWQMIQYTAQQLEAGSAAAASFARANVDLYIESVYDGHFGLAQVGKKLSEGYEKLGGADAFGSALTQAEVQRLAGAYSAARFRLHPHDGVKYGS